MGPVELSRGLSVVSDYTAQAASTTNGLGSGGMEATSGGTESHESYKQLEPDENEDTVTSDPRGEEGEDRNASEQISCRLFYMPRSYFIAIYQV